MRRLQVETEVALLPSGTTAHHGLSTAVGSANVRGIGDVVSVPCQGRFLTPYLRSERCGCWLCPTKSMAKWLWVTHASTSTHKQNVQEYCSRDAMHLNRSAHGVEGVPSGDAAHASSECAECDRLAGSVAALQRQVASYQEELETSRTRTKALQLELDIARGKVFQCESGGNLSL